MTSGPLLAPRVRFALHLGLAVTGAVSGCRGESARASSPGRSVPALHSLAPASSAFRAAAELALPTLAFVQVEALPLAALGIDGRASPPLFVEPMTARFGSGSGFVLSREGYVVTNNHVIEEAVSVVIELKDNRQFDATVVGRDTETDIAVLKVEADSLQPAMLGNSDSVEVGDWVLALGYPLGLSVTVTAGIVSGTDRSVGPSREGGGVATPIQDFIQTDAVINPGNSGGPLVDLAGRVIGINSALTSPTGYYSGYGFAIPINLVKRVVDDLIRFGKVNRPHLGLRLADVTAADAAVYRLPAVAGAEVVALDSRGPAVLAGVRLGDVIVAVDSLSVPNSGSLRSRVARLVPGESVRLEVVRYGRKVVLVVPLAGPPPSPRGDVLPRHAGEPGIGFEVGDTNRGVIVTAVARYSAAARAGVRPGQRLLAVNGRPLSSATDMVFLEAMAAKSEVLSLRVLDVALGETIINFLPQPMHVLR